MIGSDISKTVIEAADLAGNFDVVKSLVAMSATKPYISGDTLYTLLCPPQTTQSTEQHYKHNYNTDVAIYLMENCHWDIYEITTRPSFNLMEFLRLNSRLLKFPEFERALRVHLVINDLTKSLIADDIDGFEKAFNTYSASNNYLVNATSYLPESIVNEFRQNLLVNGHEFIREYLTPKLDELELNSALHVIFCNLISSQPRVELSTAMIVKLIELRIDVSLLEMYLNRPLEQWCQDNRCEDLLEQESMKKTLISRPLNKSIDQLSTIFTKSSTDVTAEDEQAIIRFLETHFTGHEQNGLMALYIRCMKDPKSLWITLAQCNFAKLLSYPGILPMNVSTQLHNVIKESANKGAIDTVEVLIKHANLYMPGALRFTAAEISEVCENAGKEMASKLAHALAPRLPEQSLFAQFCSNVASYLPTFENVIGSFDGYDSDVDKDILSTNTPFGMGKIT